MPVRLLPCFQNFSPVSSFSAKISEKRPSRWHYLDAASSPCRVAIILHKCFSCLLEKLPLWLYHNILLLWCNFHRGRGVGVGECWTSYASVIRCSYGLLEFKIGFYLPSKSGNTIKLSSLTLNAILL